MTQDSTVAMAIESDDGIKSLHQNEWRDMIEFFVRGASNQNTPAENGGLYDQVIQQVERPLIMYALRECRGNRIRAAKMLGINRNTLHKKIKALNIPVRKKNHGHS